MSFNHSHHLKIVPVGALASTMAAQTGSVDAFFLDTEVAEADDAWNCFHQEIAGKVGTATANLIAYRAKPSAQASVRLMNILTD